MHYYSNTFSEKRITNITKTVSLALKGNVPETYFQEVSTWKQDKVNILKRHKIHKIGSCEIKTFRPKCKNIQMFIIDSVPEPSIEL